MSFADWIDQYGDPATGGSWCGPKVASAPCCRPPIADGAAAWLQHLDDDHPSRDQHGGHFLVAWYQSGTHPA